MYRRDTTSHWGNYATLDLTRFLTNIASPLLQRTAHIGRARENENVLSLLSLSFLARVSNESHHPLGRCRVFVLAEKTLAHAVELAALQALVELAALAERAHHDIGGDGEQAQVLFGARRAAAKVALDQGAISICRRILIQQFHISGFPKTLE